MTEQEIKQMNIESIEYMIHMLRQGIILGTDKSGDEKEIAVLEKYLQEVQNEV